MPRSGHSALHGVNHNQKKYEECTVITLKRENIALLIRYN